MADILSEMGSRASEQTDNARYEGQRPAGKVAGAVSHVASRAKDYAQQGYDIATEKTKQYKETAEGYIQENPWYAVGIAVGVGLLIGMLWRRNRD